MNYFKSGFMGKSYIISVKAVWRFGSLCPSECYKYHTLNVLWLSSLNLLNQLTSIAIREPTWPLSWSEGRFNEHLGTEGVTLCHYLFKTNEAGMPWLGICKLFRQQKKLWMVPSLFSVWVTTFVRAPKRLLHLRVHHSYLEHYGIVKTS